MTFVNARLAGFLKGMLLSVLFVPVIYTVPLHAEVSGDRLGDFTVYPTVTPESVTPMVLIAASNDHQLYFKAYSDYHDIDEDGVVDSKDITYNHAVDYYGYFDSGKCYSYSGDRFVPSSLADSNNYCSGATWSGNFLNWATMARIDAVRRVLFGGHRRIDTAGSTVLERTYLPNDAHSWAKYYSGSDLENLTPFSGPDIADGITLCNTTVNNGSLTSQNVTDPPLVRVARGNYSLWAGNERWQCRWSGEKNSSNGNDPAKSGINASASSPSLDDDGLGGGDYTVRVEVCVSSMLEANCKEYPDGNYKPIGLLQRYGDDDKLLFGMFAGSYQKNKSGGVLVSDIGSMSDEINVDSDGTFKKVAATAQNGGVASAAAGGIINAWSLYRIINYRYGGSGENPGTYGVDGNNADNCKWGLNSFPNGTCQNWGNPFSEIYLNALRYLAGQNPTTQFSTSGTPVIDGLTTPSSWNCPLSEDNACARLSIVNINASVLSYDGDELDGAGYGIGTLGASQDSAQLTDIVGEGEGIHGNSYFVGANGSDNNQLCTGKTVSSLGAVEGICPEAPRLDGSYRIAGLAHWAHTNDIRSSDTANDAELEGTQSVDTYSVVLAPALPKISIPVPGSATATISILPACQSFYNGGLVGNCAIVNFQIVTPYTLSSDGSSAVGKFYVNWEDSEQGGDFDNDMWGTIEYTITASTVAVTTEVHDEAADFNMGFGYVIGGTTQDGYHAHSGINGYSYTDPTGVSACSGCEESNPATRVTYAINAGGSVVTLLEDPLFYAAKWGNFNDKNGNDKPDLQSEWDEQDADGKDNPDGLPDNYFLVTNPRKLEDSLQRVFEAVLEKTASGTAASVATASREGTGAVYQALYETTVIDSDAREARWIGNVHALWIDQNGFMREDGGVKGKLEGYDVDPVIEIFYDANDKVTRVRRKSSSSSGTFEDSGSSVVPLSELNPIWNARDQLSALSAATIDSQRVYASLASGGRHIVTSFDGVALDDFERSEITTSNYGYFNVALRTEAQDLVDYIRGKEVTGLRNRTVDYDGDNLPEVMRLGDIIHSTPTPVGAPAEDFQLLYGDTSYDTFRKAYLKRRQVVYVGGNDGMLHAFNSGFYDAANQSFVKQLNGEVEHPLGSELWAYVPRALLPHLKWLADPDYTHVYYIDAQPRVFDAKIFPSDTDHPGGWGTVLVVGMRFGGGAMTIDTAADGLNGGADDIELRSSYVIMDITNPESPPSLIAEISPENLGFTTSFPTAMAIRENDGSPNQWYLIFGSGPTNLGTATSSQTGRIFIYDLNDKNFVGGYGGNGTKNALDGNSFVGNPVTADWNLDYKADALYFGTAAGAAASPSGKLYRLLINGESDETAWPSPDLLLDAGQPMLVTPALGIDSKLNRWIFQGTGRLFVSEDEASKAQQSLYGVIDKNGEVGSNATAKADLLNVTAAVVKGDGSVSGVGSVSDFDSLETAVESAGGWQRDLPVSSTKSAERMVSELALLSKVLFAAAFTPDTDQCNAEGASVLYGLNFTTGTASPTLPTFGTDSGGISTPSVYLGVGLAATPSLHAAAGLNSNQVNILVQTAQGEIIQMDANTGSSAHSGETSWREIQ
ncbi:MAG: hypothetical protein GXP10_07375 [Gammaproteobacteria bacterium]|nr:hypothetical protein [Gammaproteobacteria bacterium]